MAHEVSDAEETAGLDVMAGADSTYVGEPAVAERGVGGLVPAPRPTWGTPRPQPPKPPRRDPHATRRPLIGLTALLLTTLIAAFFGWVSAEPFWLAAGRGTEGTATITSCQPSGVAQRCVGRFTGDGITVDAVRLSSVPVEVRRVGARVDARMLDANSRWAYAGPVSGLQLRWILGAVVVVLCGLLIGFATGVHRLRTAGSGGRFALWLLSLTGPLTIYAGILAATAL